MRIVIDLQGAQSSGSRNRGIGRYSLSLAQEMARQAGGNEIVVALNGRFPETIEPIRAAFEGLIPQSQIVLWHPPGPAAEITLENTWRLKAGERIREAFLQQLSPDIIHVSSLFEGLMDDAITSVGVQEGALATASTLYDLIPLIYRDPYLSNPSVRGWYKRKLAHLRRSKLVLAISESSRQEGIDWLDLHADTVVNISAAADQMFQRRTYSEKESAQVLRRNGLTRPFVMYTGGIDHRKNIEGLIRSYGQLPPGVRAKHQLAIVCSIAEPQRAALSKIARDIGMQDDELILTGFVSDADLVALYNLCTVFVFPSWHEGFGLPALEAMCCGAAVIASNTSSLPEVVGRQDALFDPFRDEQIAQKLHDVLVNDQFRGILKEYSRTQASRFSWHKSAKVALDAFTEFHLNSKRNDRVIVSGSDIARKKLAYCSPLPPEKSGIADYSASLVDELARFYEVEIIHPAADAVDPIFHAKFQIRTLDWFESNADQYHHILYHFGNSPFHQHMFSLIEKHPGIVVLHDFYLGNIIAHMDWLGVTEGELPRALYQSHGYEALSIHAAQDDLAATTWRYPCNAHVLQCATGVIVHSQHAADLADQWYGEGTSAEWAKIPLLRTNFPTLLDRDSLRRELGFDHSDFVVCSFGMLGPTKLSHKIVDAWLASELATKNNCHLVFVGENDQGEFGRQLVSSISDSSFSDARIRITGHVSAEMYRKYLRSADAAIQLRTLSRGETSAAVLDCLAYGIPTVVNAHGSMRDIPSDCVVHLADHFTDAALSLAITQLWQDRSARETLRQNGRALVNTKHRPRLVAEQYQQAIESFDNHGKKASRSRLIKSIANLDDMTATSDDWIAASKAIAQNHRFMVGRKQMLVDITVLAQIDAKSGIQRVVRSVLKSLLDAPPSGYRVEPVYADAAGTYRYARDFTLKFQNVRTGSFADDPIEVHSTDLFLGLDLAAHCVPLYKDTFKSWRNQGTTIYFVVYDVLPLLHPEWFPTGTADCFSPWIETMCQVADGAVCISKSVAEELTHWLDSKQFHRDRPFNIGWFHLGADIEASVPTLGYSDRFEEVLEKLQSDFTTLMVGTIEPRKGHAQTLSAIELLWADGIPINLVIVGKSGWGVDALVERLKNHPQAGRRLFWFENSTDEMLVELYRRADGVLMASHGEGFGLPLIEAAQYAKPILARNLPVFREIAGEHATYFNGSDEEAIAKELKHWSSAVQNGEAPDSSKLTTLSWRESALQLVNTILAQQWHANWLPGKHYRLSVQDPRVKTQVGLQIGDGLVTNSTEGALLFGPYVRVPAGRYLVRFYGANPSDLDYSGATADATIDSGATVLATSVLSPLDGDWHHHDPIAQFEFSLDSDCRDLEVRIWVTDRTRLTVSRYEFFSIQ